MKRQNVETSKGRNVAEKTCAFLRRTVCVDDSAGEGAVQTIRLTPPGKVESLVGTFIVDEESGRLAQAALEKHGTDIPIDYEHSTLKTTGEAPAAGWIKRIWFDGERGLMAAVEWTERAAKQIRAMEYRYLSPVTLIRKVDMKLVAIHSAGLTNKPAIPRMEALAASQRVLEKEFQMDPTTRQVNQEEATGGDPTIALARIAEVLGLEDTGDIAAMTQAILEAVRKLKSGEGGGSEGESEEAEVASSVRKALGLKDEAKASEVVVAINSLKQGSEKAQVSQQEVAALRDEIGEMKADKLMEPHIEANRINPKDAEDVKFCRQLAMSDPKTFEYQMGKRTPYAERGRTAAPPRESVVSGEESEDKLIANAVQAAKGSYADGLETLQRQLLQPFKDEGLTNKAAYERCARQYPKIFGAAA